MLQENISTCPAAPGRHFDLSCCSGTTFQLVLLLMDDILMPAAPVTTFRPVPLLRHLDLSCCSGTTFRRALLQENVLTCPAAADDISTCPVNSGLVLLLQDDIPTCPLCSISAALGRHFDVSSYSWTTFRLSLWDDNFRIACSKLCSKSLIIVWSKMYLKLCSKLVIDMPTPCSAKLHVHKNPPQSCGGSTLVIYIYIYIYIYI